ncbi:phosphodiesterase, MJ0936 family [Ignisphaera aggregans DSM 17230]|uniref:Phosphoesterase n=1 Tax=Ignisphaera aggregans (strain DSM 17230 / JCM 13409 / AQ1.S1) TaxID=583356 RepID=E0SQM6_IGNAA|nr:phosphodiesterase, MJ0936 family [Ignisphaera aggregans DSM 17230]
MRVSQGKISGDVKRILVMSDSHIPDRAFEIPSKIRLFIEREKYDIVVHAGDFTDYKVIEYVRTLGKETYMVQGNMDYIDLPEKEIFDAYGINIGVIHGDQVYPRGNISKLSRIAKELNARILISGHTHTPNIAFDSGILHLNPGSITGVWGGGGGSMTPTFIVLTISSDGHVTIDIYALEDDLKLYRREYIKFSL